MNETNTPIIQKLKDIRNSKYLNLFGLILNLFCILGGILYLIIKLNYSVLNLFWNSFGVVIIVGVFFNIFSTYITLRKFNKENSFGKKYYYLHLIYLLFINLSIGMIIIGNFMIGSTDMQGLMNVGLWLLIFIGYFCNFSLGAGLSLFNLINFDKSEVWVSNTSEKKEKAESEPSVLKKILDYGSIILLIILFAFGGYFVYAMVFSPLTDFAAWCFGVIMFPFSIYFSFISIEITLLLLQRVNKISRKSRPKLLYSIGILGVIFSTTFLLPIISTPFVYLKAESDFATAFGSNWESKIDSSAQDYFLNSPLSLPAYFLGIPRKQCNINSQNLFYNNESIQLFYDAYYLEGDRSSLPGNSSVLINLHGGGWTGGDKGQGNLPFVCSYFAAQGYVVFDIQYGLIAEDNLFQRITESPAYLIGDFSIEDQLRHIGVFIKKLNSSEFSTYNLNLDSVFITGGSAGGHLTLATTLLINNGSYSEWFGSAIQIKGMIPLYPGDPPERYGNDTYLNPEAYFIDDNSPPCLMFQGLKDFCLLKTQQIQASYITASNNDCCVVWFPFQGHANDIYHPGYFNLYMIYYMERFLYLCTYGLIV